MPTLDLGPVVGPQGPQGETGPAGPQGIQGPAGPSATINGLPAVTITGGEKIRLEQAGSDLTINCTASNPNLLLNWDFRSPVNRNGRTEYTGSGYAIDKWTFFAGNSSLLVTEEGIVLTGSIRQFLKNPSALSDSIITMSALVKGDSSGEARINVYSAELAINYYKDFSLTGDWQLISHTTKLGELTRNLGTDLAFLFQRATSLKILAAKLEFGSVQTLAWQNEEGAWELIDPPDYDLQYALCSQYSPITGKWVGSQHSNQNLIINGDFRNPVNRNGNTEYTGTNTGIYTIDQWGLFRGTLSVLADAIELSDSSANATYFYNAVKDSVKLAGENLTFSIFADIPEGVNFEFHWANESNQTTKISSFSGAGEALYAATFSAANAFRSIGIILPKGAAGQQKKIKIYAAKLELGSVQTLARKNSAGEWELIDSPDYTSQYTLCSQYSPITGNFVGSQQSNEQLMDNGNFFDPVNQKNESTYTSAKNGYFLDRWSFHNGGGSYDVATRTLTMVQKAYSGIYQRIESPQRFVGKRLTASFLYAADIPTQLQLVAIVNNTRTAIAYTEAPARETPECVSVSGIIPSGAIALDVQLFNHSASSAPAGTAILGAAKLELGPVQTLAHKEGNTWVLNDPPPNKAQELAKCQRYQLMLTGSGNAMIGSGIVNAGNFWWLAPTPVSMRSKPTVVVAGNGIFAIGKNETNITLSNTNVYSYTNNSVKLVSVIAGGSMEAGETGIVQIVNANPRGSVLLDANL